MDKYREITKDDLLPDETVLPMVWCRYKDRENNNDTWSESGFSGNEFRCFRDASFKTMEYRILASDWPKSEESTKPKPKVIHKMRKASKKGTINLVDENTPLDQLPEFGKDCQIVYRESEEDELMVQIGCLNFVKHNSSGTEQVWDFENVIGWCPAIELPEEDK